MDEECYGECDECASEYDPDEHDAECECGGVIQLVACVDGCDFCEDVRE